VRASALYSGDKLTNLRRRTPAGGIANTRLEYDSSARNRPVHLIVSKGDCADASCETSFALAYDPRGNRISEIPSSGQGADVESRRFTYGPDNRLRMLRVASPEAPDSDCSPTRWDQVDTDVGYDHAGMLAFRRRRIGMTTQQVVKYSRTPAGQIGYSLQASGSTGTNRVTYKYLHLSGERVLAVRETWEGTERTSRKYLFLHTDRNGAPVAAFVNDHSEGEGAQQWSADRDPWGWTKITSAFPADEIPFEFPGQLRLDGTEVKRLVVGSDGCQAEVIQPAIVNNGYRDYDPVAGIYLSRDPIALAGSGWSQSWTNRNLYAYAGFSPVDHFDYWGLETPGSSDNATFFKSLIPIYGPAMGMGDAIVQGDWSMAVMNAGFLVLDVASLGTMAVVRDVGTGAIRGLLSAEARTAERAALTEGVEIVEAASKCEAATRGGNILANKAAGDAFRDEIADALKASGRDVEKEVVKQTPFGRRVIDVEVSQGGKVLGGVETKVGESRYLPSQRAKDEWLRQQGYPVNVVRDR
jgi:RHS repeat-associated protein